MKIFFKTLYFILYFIFVIALIPLKIFAQPVTKVVNTQYQTWYSINSTMRLHKKWGIVADFHARRNDFLADQNFYYFRAGVNYWVKNNLTVTLAYGHLWLSPSQTDWKTIVQENRLQEQIQLSSKLKKAAVINRIRNEQRWQQKIVNDSITGKLKFSNRVRYLLSFTLPVFKNPHYPSLVLSDELLVQFGKEIVYNTFDQNRFFIGIKQPVCKSLSFDFGYMLVYQQKASGYQYDKNHTLRLFFYYTPDFTKK